MNAYWSIEECGWVAATAGADVHWSVQRCRWEPVDAATEALPTPWSMFRPDPQGVPVPDQRAARPVVVDA